MGEDALHALNDLDVPLGRRARAPARRGPAAHAVDRGALRAEHRRGARRGGRQARVLVGLPGARRVVRGPAAVLDPRRRRDLLRTLLASRSTPSPPSRRDRRLLCATPGRPRRGCVGVAPFGIGAALLAIARPLRRATGRGRHARRGAVRRRRGPAVRRRLGVPGRRGARPSLVAGSTRRVLGGAGGARPARRDRTS